MWPARLLPAGLAAVLLCSLAASRLPAPSDVIVLGAAVSLTGKYALNGANTKNGYELAVREINDKGGVKIGGKRLQARGALLRRRVDAGARHRACRAADQAGWRQIHARALQLGPDQGHSAGRGEVQGADDRGERRRARAVHQGLSLHLRRALHLRPISHAGHRTRRRACRRSSARARTSSRSRWPWRTIRSRKMCAPACSTTCGATA